jgi:type IV secretory pathway ATPase VirB11/archaellum biosynthesis ATPase
MYRKHSRKGFLMSDSFGPVEALLNDSAITAIHMTPTKIEYHKNGQAHVNQETFQNEAEFHHIIGAILQSANQTLTAENSPVNCVLSDGTQVHATYTPLFMSLTKSN